MPADASQPTVVSIAGHVGSGKSATARIVAETLGWSHLSTGEMFRQIARRLDMTVLELNRHAETDGSIDEEIDGYLRGLAGVAHDVVIDSRMAWHFVPESLKVFLLVDPIEGARRVLRAGRADETYASLEDAAAANIARMAAEAERYHELYGVRRDDWRNYDLVIDTTDIAKEAVATRIVGAIIGPPSERSGVWLATRRLRRNGAIKAGDTVEVDIRDGVGSVRSGWDLVDQARSAAEPLIRCRLVGYEGSPVD
ncbi:MAG TPA: cytidylate kinase family protein [Acidimicrobiia bacterium]|nr:cytidylate kinase family protein [Acidimicrobiia bacterium]